MSPAAVSLEAPPVRKQESKDLRPDIQGLRALAVLSVLLFHLWPTRLTGGFVGVDVFFVISGFLITSHLLREVESTGHIGVARFWARRAKRLLPASLLVLTVVAIVTVVVVPRLLWNQFLSEVIASTLYVENWLLANNAVDYMAADNLASPVQHFWTLSVEEQFYIALPLVLLATLAIARWRRWPVRRTSLAAIAVLTVASFGYSVWLTYWSANSAYFSTLTRAWEFGAGALIVALPAMRSVVVRSVVAAAGLAAIVAAVVFYGPATPFPGYAAALPVLGTAAVIWAGSRTFADAVGAFRPVAFVGGISYAVYLWHWPPIVLLPYVTGHPLTTIEKTAILVATIFIAWLSTEQWENRIRFSPRLLGTARPRVVALWMILAMVVTLAVPAVALTVNARETAREAVVAQEIADGSPDCFGAEALALDCTNPDLDGVLVPNPADLPNDDGNRSECWSRGEDATVNWCSVGPASGYDKHLLAVGDSHSNSLVGAYERIANEHNWRIDITGRAGCYWSTATLVAPTEALTAICTQWRENVVADIGERADVDAIVVTKARRPATTEVAAPAGTDPYELIVAGMTEAWSARPDLNVPVIALVDNPMLPKTTPGCVAASEVPDAADCAIPRADALLPDGIADAAAQTPNAAVIDLTDLYCTADTCPAVVGSVIVYRDGRHLTGTYADTVAPFLGDRIAEILAAKG
ncbi:acyltransferase family protein [Microbacterium pumilum]|uniref:Acyltransferase family protein n=1 Tax=Microbacterium pumilum TaxID=344165 RepID=A0ABN2SDT6_9MICO